MRRCYEAGYEYDRCETLDEALGVLFDEQVLGRGEVHYCPQYQDESYIETGHYKYTEETFGPTVAVLLKWKRKDKYRDVSGLIPCDEAAEIIKENWERKV